MFVEWVLILSSIALNTTQSPNTFFSVPGFQSYEECIAAGAQVVKGFQKNTPVRYTCVRQTKKVV